MNERHTIYWQFQGGEKDWVFVCCVHVEKKITGWKECDYKQQHTLKSKHKSNKLVLYAAAATSTATSKYTKKK